MACQGYQAKISTSCFGRIRAAGRFVPADQNQAQILVSCGNRRISPPQRGDRWPKDHPQVVPEDQGDDCGVYSVEHPEQRKHQVAVADLNLVLTCRDLETGQPAGTGTISRFSLAAVDIEMETGIVRH